MKRALFILFICAAYGGTTLRAEFVGRTENSPSSNQLLIMESLPPDGPQKSGGGLASDSMLIGSAAPTFVLRNIGGGDPVFLRDFAGTTLRRTARNKSHQVVVLSFWAPWCEPCTKEIPILSKLAAEFVDKPVKFFLVNTLEQSKQPTYTEDSVKAVINARGYVIPCLVDAIGRVAESYRVRSLPALVVIDKEGIIRRINRGYEEGFETALRTLLNDLAQK